MREQTSQQPPAGILELPAFGAIKAGRVLAQDDH